jgi:deazaflavin-dependent oxidoreductase (nitroreductase family)
MGLWEELGCELRPPTTIHRTVRAIAAQRLASRALTRVQPQLDRLVATATAGRASVTQILSGLPTITLVTLGARTGQRRHTSLLAIPTGDDIGVIGSNYGNAQTPAWVHNLRAHADVEVEHAGRTLAAKARQLGGTEAEAVWEQAREMYAGYQHYPQWASEREITVWLLSTRDA